MRQLVVLLWASVVLTYLVCSICGLAEKAENKFLRVPANLAFGTLGDVSQVGYRRRAGGRGRCGGNTTVTTTVATTATTASTAVATTASTTAATAPTTTTTVAATG